MYVPSARLTCYVQLLRGLKTMFLIEYDAGAFVNATEINWLRVSEKGSQFTLKGYTSGVFNVGADYCKTFFNNLQALNGNVTNVESIWHKLNT